MSSQLESAARLVLVATVLAGGGCFDTSVNALPDAGDNNGNGFAIDTDQCDLLMDEYVGGTTLGVAYDDYSVEIMDGKWVEGDGLYESLAIAELYGAEPGDVIDLAGESQYMLCDYCVLVFLGCPPPPADLWDCDSFYIATSGSIEVVQINPDQPWDNPVEILVSYAVLEQCDINWSNYESVLKADGSKICVGTWHAEVTPELE
jgi:hypothetical protein